MPDDGALGDAHELSARARRYANSVIKDEEWPLTPDHVNLACVTFETSTRMKRQHGVCSSDGRGNCTIRLSELTYDRAGFEAIQETIRHELVHAYQHQTDGVAPGHGDSFTRWVDPLDLAGRYSTHYDTRSEDYTYRFYCAQSCGFIGGRHRWSVAVRRAIQGNQVCGSCDGPLRVEGPDGVLDEVPESRQNTNIDEDDLQYRFYCANCGFIGGRRQMCKTVRQVVRKETVCRDCGSQDIETRDSDSSTITLIDWNERVSTSFYGSSPC